jgi:hypothetical protein
VKYTKNDILPVGNTSDESRFMKMGEYNYGKTLGSVVVPSLIVGHQIY